MKHWKLSISAGIIFVDEVQSTLPMELKYTENFLRSSVKYFVLLGECSIEKMQSGDEWFWS